MNKNTNDPTLCFICLESYNVLNKPLILMCGHTFCETCIKLIWNDKREIKCSYCKIITTADKLEDIVVNYSVLSASDYLYNLKQTVSSNNNFNNININNQDSNKKINSLNILNSKIKVNCKISSNTNSYENDNKSDKNKNNTTSDNLNTKLSNAINKFINHTCNIKDNVHFSEDKITTLKICNNCYSIHCNECYIIYQHTSDSLTQQSKCIYCDYLNNNKKEYTFNGEKLNIENIKHNKKSVGKVDNKYHLETLRFKNIFINSGNNTSLIDYDCYITSNFEKFKKDYIVKFEELAFLYNEYMMSCSEDTLKTLLEEEINKAKRKFSDMISRLKKEEEHSILRMNMAFERKMQDYMVLNKEQNTVISEINRFTKLINDNCDYKNLSVRSKVIANRVLNFPYLIYEINEFLNEADARIEAFKEVGGSCNFESIKDKQNNVKIKEGLFMIELRENLSNCVRLLHYN